jgi:hypothetical protein
MIKLGVLEDFAFVYFMFSDNRYPKWNTNRWLKWNTMSPINISILDKNDICRCLYSTEKNTFFKCTHKTLSI